MFTRLLGTLLATFPLAAFAAENSPLTLWQSHVTIQPILKDTDRHSIHTYYVTSPESPDSRYVLLYTSTDPAGHKGSVVTVDRTSGNPTTLAQNVVTEDTHRVACQQWISGGRRVAYHTVLTSGEWVVNAVDVATGDERTLARGEDELRNLLGMDRFEARSAIVEWFKSEKLLEEIKPYRHTVGHSYRSNVPIEP